MKIGPIDHLCRFCGIGRLEVKDDGNGKRAIWCPNCEQEADGSHEKLCFCGHRFPSGAKSYLKCLKNPERTPENPHTVVVVLDESAVVKRHYVGKPKRDPGANSLDLFEDDEP